MNIKKYAIGIFCLFTFATYAQSGNSAKIDTDHSVSELKIETDSLEELMAFDWKTVPDIFENNDPDKSIKLHLGFKEDLALENSRLEKWTMTLSGKTSDLESMIRRSKNIINNLSEIEKE
jgi:hypothetical protein